MSREYDREHMIFWIVARTRITEEYLDTLPLIELKEIYDRFESFYERVK